MSGREIHCPDCDSLVRIPDISEAPKTPAATVQEAIGNPFEDLSIDLVRKQPPKAQSVRKIAIVQPDVKSNEEPTEPIGFAKRELPTDDMDMTPMVDVTFLLLIFFMITASFTTEKAIQQKAANDQASSQAVPTDDIVPLKILIDEFNAYVVIFPDGGEDEATSKQELITILKRSELDGSNEDATSIVIEAHAESIHASVVGALDAGRQQNFTNFKVTIVEDFD